MGPAVILMVIIAPFCYGASIQYKRSDVKPLQTNISGWFIEETNKTFQSLEGPENLHEFLEEHLEKPILECTLSPLTKPGENYRSELQALEVKFNESNHSNKVQTLQLVCKIALKDVDVVKQSERFVKEINFYSNIVPAIKQFERNANIPKYKRIDAFVRFFGSRLSLDPHAKSADTDALILLENVKTQDYVCPSRWDKLDRSEIVAVLNQLAKLHALCIAMRRLNPNLYYSKIHPYLYEKDNDSRVEHIIKRTQKFVDNLPRAFPNMHKTLQKSIEKQLDDCRKYLRNSNRTPDTPYTTFYHKDLWVKNIMMKSSGDVASKKMIHVEILDFQKYGYESFAFNLIHFLSLNAHAHDLQVNFKSFIKHYHSVFVKTLRSVNCPLDDYTYDKMWQEIKEKAKFNLLNLYYYLALDQFSLAGDNPVPEDPNDFHIQQSTPQVILNRWKCIHDLYIENGFI